MWDRRRLPRLSPQPGHGILTRTRRCSRLWPQSKSGRRPAAVLALALIADPGGMVIAVIKRPFGIARAQRARIFNRDIAADVKHAPSVRQVSLFGAAVPAHLERVRSINLGIAFRVVVIVQAGFRPAHAAHHQIAESVAFFVLSVALLAKPLRRSRQQLVFLRHAEPPRQELHFLPVADFLTGDAVDRCSYAVENDNRALCVLQNRLVVFVQLLAGFKVEIFASFSAPVGLAFAVIVGLYVALQPAKQPFRVLYRPAGLAAAMSVRVVEHSNRPLLIGIGSISAEEMIFPGSTCGDSAVDYAPVREYTDRMPTSQTPTCSSCQRPMTLELQPGGKSPRTFQCLDCERPDPLKSRALDGIMGALRPPAAS